MLSQAEVESRSLRQAVDSYKPLRETVENFLSKGTEFQIPREGFLTRILKDLTDPDRPKAQSLTFLERGVRVTTPDETPCSVMVRTDAYGDPDAGNLHRALIILSLVVNPSFPASEVTRTLPPVHAIGKRDNLWGAAQVEQLVGNLQEIPALLALADEL